MMHNKRRYGSLSLNSTCLLTKFIGFAHFHAGARGATKPTPSTPARGLTLPYRVSSRRLRFFWGSKVRLSQSRTPCPCRRRSRPDLQKRDLGFSHILGGAGTTACRGARGATPRRRAPRTSYQWRMTPLGGGLGSTVAPRERHPAPQLRMRRSR